MMVALFSVAPKNCFNLNFANFIVERAFLSEQRKTFTNLRRMEHYVLRVVSHGPSCGFFIEIYTKQLYRYQIDYNTQLKMKEIISCIFDSQAIILMQQ